MLAELAQYIAPKRKAIDHNMMPGAPAAMGPRVIKMVGVKPDPTRFPDRAGVAELS